MCKTTLLGLLAGATLVLAACSGPGAANQQNSLTVEARDLAFSPAALEVTAGQPVQLTLRNNGTLAHDFSILEFPMEGEAEESGGMDHEMDGMAEDPELHVAAAAGQSATLEFTPTKLGSYQFWCTVPGHKEAGMTGSLEVKGP